MNTVLPVLLIKITEKFMLFKTKERKDHIVLRETVLGMTVTDLELDLSYTLAK